MIRLDRVRQLAALGHDHVTRIVPIRAISFSRPIMEPKLTLLCVGFATALLFRLWN
jgi:hypothetical protein